MATLADTMKNLGPTKMMMMGGVIFAVILFFLFISMRFTGTDMSLLYSDLSISDQSAIASKLQSAGITFNMNENNTQVLVKRDQVGRARMLLAEEGLPSSASIGYEIFDKQSGFGTTDFVQNINQLRALEGELSRTIGTLEPIRAARVHIVLPKRELFSREAQPATASIFLRMRAGQTLAREQISSIQHIVAAAVPQLRPNRVSIVDEFGNLLARGGEDEEENAFLTQNAQELRNRHENRMKSSIEEMITRVVGPGKVRATVAVDLDFDRVTMNAEIYDPDGQVLRSSQTISENEEERDAGPEGVTIQNNLPGLADGLQGDAGTMMRANRTEEITNFEITRTVKNQVREAGQIRRISVAVLVDGTYTTNEAGEQVYTPRSEREIEQIETLVRSAVGYDIDRGDRIEIVNMPFVEVAPEIEEITDHLIFGFEKRDLLSIAETVTLAIVALLVVLLVLQPLVNKLVESASAGAANFEGEIENLLVTQQQQQPALIGADGQPIEEESAEEMINLQNVVGKMKASTYNKVSELVEQHPAETVNVLRNWMYQE